MALRVDDSDEQAMHSHESPDIHRRAQPQRAEKHDTRKDEQGQGAGGARSPEGLHVCFHCAGELVYPLDWSEEGLRHWRILLRCPECGSRREGVFEQAAVERLDDELDRASSALLGDLRRMTHANMTEEVAFFIRALAADLIVPSDF